jgi:hypothetical protein
MAGQVLSQVDPALKAIYARKASKKNLFGNLLDVSNCMYCKGPHLRWLQADLFLSGYLHVYHCNNPSDFLFASHIGCIFQLPKLLNPNP